MDMWKEMVSTKSLIAARDAALRAAFNGSNHAELADQSGMSIPLVLRIVAPDARNQAQTTLEKTTMNNDQEKMRAEYALQKEARRRLLRDLCGRFPVFDDVFVCMGVVAMFNGHNHDECAKAFGLTQNSVYCIVKYANLMHQAAEGKTSLLLWQGPLNELAGQRGYEAAQSDVQKLAALGVLVPDQALVSVRLELASTGAADHAPADCECSSAKTPLSTDTHEQPEHGLPVPDSDR